MIPFIVLSIIALLVVFGTGLLALFYRIVPGFDFSRVDRVILIYMAGISILAGYGYDIAGGQSIGRRGVYIGLGFIAFAVGLGTWLHTSGLDMVLSQAGGMVTRETYFDYASGKILSFVALALLSGGLLIVRGLGKLSGRIFFIGVMALLMFDLLPKGGRFKISQPADGIVPPSSFVDEMRAEGGTWRFAKFGAEVIPSNTATLLGFDDIHGYDALNVNHYIEVLGAVDSTVIAASNAALRRRIGPIGDRNGLGSSILDLLNVKHVLSVMELPGKTRRPVSWVNRDHLPRAFLVSRARYFKAFDEMLAYMKSDRFVPAAEVLLIGDVTTDDGEVHDSLAVVEAGTAEISRSNANETAIQVNALSECYLVLSDVYYPGWRAFVDGKEEELLRANYAFRAVRLSPGLHTVTMTYVPVYFRVGLILSVAGIALLSVLISSKSRLTHSNGG
jgi:hypothetical protein